MNAPNNAAPPPAYSFRPVTSISRMNRRPLRGSVMTFCVIALIWSAVWAGYNFKYSAGDTVSKMKTIDLVIAIIFTVVAALEAFGVVACWKATRRLVRLYSFAAIACAVLAVGGGLLAFIFNFIFKSDLLRQCEEDATSGGVTLRTGWWWDESETQLTDAEAYSFCQSKWKRGVWGDVILVAAIVFLSSLAALFAVAYSRQLASSEFDGGGIQMDPAQGVPLATYESRLPDYVPEYPGPPESGPVSDTKHFAAHTAQDAAWNEALTESERREWDQHNADQAAAAGNAQSHQQQQQRYGNDEEDEAWEEARRNGGTAHLTAGTSNPWGAGGVHGGGNRRRADDDDEGGRI